jgi:hypothetical protein
LRFSSAAPVESHVPSTAIWRSSRSGDLLQKGQTTVMIFALSALAVMLGQVPGYPNNCTRCGVISYVDIPANGAGVVEGSLYIAGWGFECESGQPADRVDVFYQGDNGDYVPAGGAGAHGNGDLYQGLARPDVQAAFRGHCPTLGGYTGWHFYFTHAVPPGTRQLAINVWRGAYFQTHYRTVTIR